MLCSARSTLPSCPSARPARSLRLRAEGHLLPEPAQGPAGLGPLLRQQTPGFPGLGHCQASCCVCAPGNEMLPQPENRDRFKLLSWGPTPAAAFSRRAAPELRARQLSPDPRWPWPAGGHASSVIASLLSVNRRYFLLGRLTPNLPCTRYGRAGARPAC